MSMTLGEKLREAREARGFSLSEVAEQTRISALYLESIENDDYRRLPGGIFNKGFVKSYAKFVGVDEQEALRDYSQLMAQAELAEESELKVYKPEVLTDDRTGPSMVPTIIIAAVILGLMTGGILFLVNYLRRPADETAANSTPRPAANASPEATPEGPPASDVPDMATLRVEFKATTQPVRLRATVDGSDSDNVVAAGSTQTFEPKQSLVLNYNRWNAAVVELAINGKPITLPGAPLSPSDKDRIVFTISRETLAQIWTSGSISTEVPPAETETNTNTTPEQPPAAPSATLPATAPSPTRPTASPRPSVPANAANAPAKTPVKTPAKTPEPKPANTARPAANNE